MEELEQALLEYSLKKLRRTGSNEYHHPGNVLLGSQDFSRQNIVYSELLLQDVLINRIGNKFVLEEANGTLHHAAFPHKWMRTPIGLYALSSVQRPKAHVAAGLLFRTLPVTEYVLQEFRNQALRARPALLQLYAHYWPPIGLQ